MANPNQDARNHTNGRYVRTPEMATRDAEAARLQGEGYTYREIANELGYSDKAAALRGVRRAYHAIAKKGGAGRALERRQQELDLLWESAMEILENNHVVVSNGKVIAINGDPLSDDGPRLQAIAELRRINESRRKLEGTDQPAKTEVTLGDIKPEDIELTEIIRKRQARNAATEEQIRREGQ